MKLRAAIPRVAIVLLATFALAFALINYSNPARVWPLPGTQPLTVVIAVAFLLGAGISGLIVHLVHQKRKALIIPSSANIDPR
jgi:hypothetical protein